jgi:putative ABC transport system permease protein
MISNYFKIAFRNILKYKAHSFVNVMGLALGIAVFFISIQFVTYQFSWDKFHAKADDIYRIHQKFNDGGTTANVSYPIKNALVNDYPEIQLATSIAFNQGNRLFYNSKQMLTENIILAEPEFFEMFNVEFQEGNSEKTIADFGSNPGVAIITSQYAKVLFGDENPMGKIFTLENINTGPSYKIEAIVSEFPENSHFQFNILIPIISNQFLREVENNWNNPVVHTYLYIPDKQKAKEFNQDKLDDFIDKHFPPKFGGPDAHLPVIAMTDIHLNSHLYYELGNNNSMVVVWIVTSVGVLILILASLNFMNLTTARSTRRAKEVGLRKSLGASKSLLIRQFIGEAIIFSLISVMAGMILAEGFLPIFNKYLNQDLKIEYFNNWFTIPVMLSIGLLVGFISGIYPAFVLSSFNPINALKDTKSKSNGGFLVRKGLVVLQFVVVALLLVTIIAMQQQLSFMANKDLGYDYRNVVYVRSSEKMGENPDNYKSFIEEIKSSGYILHISGVSNWSYQSMEFEGMKPNERKGAIIMEAGADYPRAMGIQLVSGRFPSSERIADNKSMLLNETAAENLGWDALESIGKSITIYEGDSTYTVIGVMKDFHIDNLTQKIEPMAMIPNATDFYPVSMMKITELKKDESIAAIEKAWRRFDDGWPFEVYFSQSQVEQSYTEIQNLQSMMSQLTYLGIFIACMGLYGLAAFSAERRIKEIGIRKVMGASILSIWRLMVSEFALIVVVATGIGVVAGYFISDVILQNFAYRIVVGIPIVISSIIISVGIAVVTVSYQALKSARVNPVDTLKIE